MNDRAMAIAILCSHLCIGAGVEPLEPKEYSSFAGLLASKKINPEDLLGFDRLEFLTKLEVSEEQADRLVRLMERSASLSFEISRYESMGISIVTRADTEYPKKLKKKLRNSCPPLFYTAGDLSVLDRPAIGFVGSRTVNDDDTAFTRNTVRKTLSQGFAVVSGGAKGCDMIAEEEALSSGGNAIAFLSDSMLRKLKNNRTIQAVQQGKLTLLSVVKPDAGFQTGVAMMRNKYIYAQSEAAVVIKADYNKGGTWSGATENLRNRWSFTLCRNKLTYPGNKALIEKGAYPIDETWDGDIRRYTEETRQEGTEQISLFDDDDRT